MTISFPDVSNYEGAMLLEAGTVAVCTKVSEGTTYADPFYGHYKAEAKRVGAVFFGYHFLHAGSAAAQADHCFALTGPGVNVMIDHEPTAGSVPTVQDALDFAARFRARGGICTLAYLPPWYWRTPVDKGGLGSPPLAPLAQAGISLVSSDYTAYGDSGPGWAPYGGVTPAIWQYTDRQAYSGQQVDFNAYRGTVEQLRILLGYAAAPNTAPPTAATRDDDMQLLNGFNGPAVAALSGDLLWDVRDGAAVTGYQKAGQQVATIDAAEYASITGAIEARRKALAAAIGAAVTVSLPALTDAQVVLLGRTVAAGVVAGLSDPALLAKLAAADAHAQAVEEHNDTPPA